MTLPTDIEGHGHILFPMADYVGVLVKHNSIRHIVCEILEFTAFVLRPGPLTLEVMVTFCSPWVIMRVYMLNTIP